MKGLDKEEPNYERIIFPMDDGGEIREIHLTYPKKLSWCCLKCGKCCKNTQSKDRCILLLPSDIERIGLKEDFYHELNNNNKPFIGKMRMVDNNCIFLRENTCSVYENRALLCRTYPFYIKKSKGKYIIKYDPACPGIGKDGYIQKSYFVELLKYCISKMEENIE
jgi:Fe-S-cluster containining protein